MFRSLLFYRTFSKKCFARTLARYSDFPKLNNSYLQYASYRLGLYRTVADTPFYAGRNWRGGFARAVSLSACGRHDEAHEQVKALLDSASVTALIKCELADCIAPFNPELAYQIMPQSAVQVPLKAALWLRVGQQKEARELLAGHIATNEGNVSPESWLYFSNAAHEQTPAEKLDLLNRFLDLQRVTWLRVIDYTKSPGPMNLQLAEPVPEVRGPLVSVLMTAFNSSERIGTAIRSVLNQSYRDLELIMIDDASCDATGEVVKSLMREDPRVQYRRLPCNVGTYIAKNIGLQYAKGEFVTCHDSDDWSHPLKIERQVMPLLRNRKLVCTISDWVRMQDDGTYYARPVHPLQRLNPSSPLFRRKEVLEKTGAWDCVRTGADSEFAARLKIVFGRKAVLRIREPLSFGAHRPDSLMTGSTTGYTENRVPPDRLDYWESWTYWHIEELRAGRKPRMPGLLEERAFNAPFSILVPRDHITSNLETTLFQCT